MTQEKKRNYRRKPVDNLASAATEMGNIPPQALDMEAAVLGAMMVNTDSVDQSMDLLKPESFYDGRHRAIFESMYELFNERSPIDMLTVVDKMKQKGTLNEVGGPARLAALTQQVGTGANVEYYVRILQQKAIQRNLIEASYGILKNAFDPSIPVDDLVTTAQDNVYNAMGGNNENKMFRYLFKELLPNEEMFDSSDILCISDFGWCELDDDVKELISQAKNGGMKFYGLAVAEHLWMGFGPEESMKIMDSKWQWHGGECISLNEDQKAE